ncbi:MAG: hypothetical protein AAGA45_08270, partial [Verrucomicrobiota bacterium]
KLDPKITWIPFHPRALAMINTELIEGESLMLQSVSVMQQYYTNPFELIFTEDTEDPSLEQWIVAHNAVVKEYAALQNKSYSVAEMNKVQGIINNRGKAKGRSLSRFFERNAERMESLPLIPETAFHRQKLDQLHNGFDEMAKWNDKLNDTLW